MARTFAFWMVWREYTPAPVKQHFSEDDAEKEAERLAAANPGIAFFVLKAERAVKVQAPTVWRQLKPVANHPNDCQCDDCTIPF